MGSKKSSKFELISKTAPIVIAVLALFGFLGYNQIRDFFPSNFQDKKPHKSTDSSEVSEKPFTESIGNNSSDSGAIPTLAQAKSLEYDTVTVMLPSRYQGASIQIDGMSAQVLERTRTTAKLRIPVKTNNQIIEINKDGEPGCKQELPLNIDQTITPCQN